MRVIGTAGHIDHGKSTLISAITGTHPDRLKEEIEREMTIELGFAWFNLPDGEEIGIVDVPGHRDFIGNMLAGVGGIDAVLLVIAADEGVMPQTREHLAILDLLQIQTGLIVMTKIDMVQDVEWLDLIESDIRSILMGTVLESAPIVRVSSRTKAGLPDLIKSLSELLKDLPPRPDLGRPRLPVDRVFSLSGFGTVVTGTLMDGKFMVGEEIEVLPEGHRGRIRGLQNHKKKEEYAIPGSRTAINISGLNVEMIQRGDAIVHPLQYIPTRMLDVQFHLLENVSNPIKHGSEVKLYIGSSETIATIRLLGMETLEPGQTGWLQLELRTPVVAVRGDRFILRRPSPSETLGGGKIIDPHPKKRHKRFSSELIKNFESLAQGAPSEIMLQASISSGPSMLKDIIQRARLEMYQGLEAYHELVSNGLLIILDNGSAIAEMDGLVIAQSQWNDISNQIEMMTNEFHRNQPLRPGIPREELKSRLKLSISIFNAILQKMEGSGRIVEKGSLVTRPGFEIKFSPAQKLSIDPFLQKINKTPFSPPSVKESIAEIGDEVFHALIETGELRLVSEDVFFHSRDYETLRSHTVQFIEKKGQITVAEARDLFNTSRRYVLAFLEHLDSIGVTRRDGDFRLLKRS